MHTEIVPKSNFLKEAIAAITQHKPEHGERNRRMMGISQILSDAPSHARSDPETGRYPWADIFEWGTEKIYFPRRDNDGQPVRSVAVMTSSDLPDEELIAKRLYLLMGQLR